MLGWASPAELRQGTERKWSPWEAMLGSTGEQLGPGADGGPAPLGSSRRQWSRPTKG